MKPLAKVALIFCLVILTTTISGLANDHRDPETAKPLKTLDLSKIDRPIIKQFENAWQVSKCGTSHSEGVVLIYRMFGGSYRGDFLGASNEFKQFTFNMNSAVIAVVHTHPNTSPARPSADDILVADKYKVLMFTITLRGMYVYDPFTKKISTVMDGVDWLQPAKWNETLAIKMAKVSDSFVVRESSPVVAYQFPDFIAWL